MMALYASPVSLSLRQESGTAGESVRGGPDEDLGRGLATQAATDRGGGAALEGETGTAASGRRVQKSSSQKASS